MKKKSLVGWIHRDWRRGVYYNQKNEVYIGTIKRTKAESIYYTYASHIRVGEKDKKAVVKVRITIEEI